MPPGRFSASSTGAPEAMPAASPVTPPPRISLSWYSCVISGQTCHPPQRFTKSGGRREKFEQTASVASSPTEIGSTARQLCVVVPTYNEMDNMLAQSTTCYGQCLYGRWRYRAQLMAGPLCKRAGAVVTASGEDDGKQRRAYCHRGR